MPDRAGAVLRLTGIGVIPFRLDVGHGAQDFRFCGVRCFGSRIVIHIRTEGVFGAVRVMQRCISVFVHGRVLLLGMFRQSQPYRMAALLLAIIVA